MISFFIHSFIIDRHSDEIKALKDKFGQDMNLADESIDRIRSIHSNTHVNQLQILKKTEQETILQLKAKNQQEINGVIQMHANEFERIRAELEQQFITWKSEYQSEVSKIFDPQLLLSYYCYYDYFEILLRWNHIVFRESLRLKIE